ncbi:hypothetical protein [Streptomyces arenae]|uniref:hypothetical protein n=1 Tax=Streptomyces arenae TaxID=29301 RepID=UPI002659A735|nr:hypothetical protein [Streptomyces arenae]MCG7208160.1 hypothetical protein [Streptomyces arenae]
MAFIHNSGAGGLFYQINNGLDSVWLDLRSIQQASPSALMRVRGVAESLIDRLEDVGGEAAGFAADAISLSVASMSSFLGQVALGILLSEQGGEDLLPGAVGRPHPKPVVGSLPRPEMLGQVQSRCGI